MIIGLHPPCSGSPFGSQKLKLPLMPKLIYPPGTLPNWNFHPFKKRRLITSLKTLKSAGVVLCIEAMVLNLVWPWTSLAVEGMQCLDARLCVLCLISGCHDHTLINITYSGQLVFPGQQAVSRAGRTFFVQKFTKPVEEPRWCRLTTYCLIKIQEFKGEQGGERSP